MAYISPRVLRADRCYSAPVQVYCSILQGNGQSCNMARALLHRMLDHWHRTCRPATVRTWVDDLPQHMEGTSRYITAFFLPAAEGLVAGLRRLKLTLSPKSTLVSSDKALAKYIQAKLASRGIDVLVANHSRDLGNDDAAGSRRVVATMRARNKKAQRKDGKTRSLKKAGLATCRYIRQSSFPQRVWGHQLFGVAPVTMQMIGLIRQARYLIV